MDGEIVCCNHSTLAWYHLLLLLMIIMIMIIIIFSIIMIIVMIIMIIIWKGYFSVNPILSFRNFNVVIAFKYL